MVDPWRFCDLLSGVLGTHEQYGKGETYWSCPFCHHHKKKLAINLTKGKWHCWKCGASGPTIRSLLNRLDVSASLRSALLQATSEDGSLIPPTVEEEEPLLQLPEEYAPIGARNAPRSHSKALSYLRRRQISTGDVLCRRIGFCATGRYYNRLIIPSYDSKDKLNYFVARDVTGKTDYKYLNPPVSKDIVSFENLISWSHPIVLCEGYLDAIRIKWNALPLIGTILQDRVKQKLLINGVKQVFVCLDPDARDKAFKIAQTLMGEGIRVHIVDLPGTKDPADYSQRELLDRIFSAPEADMKQLITFKLR